jgi:hypothetical protein
MASDGSLSSTQHLDIDALADVERGVLGAIGVQAHMPLIWLRTSKSLPLAGFLPAPSPRRKPFTAQVLKG